MVKARTIQIFLPDGNPRGLKIAEITNRTIQAIFVPRASAGLALARPEVQNVGVYFLVGESEDDGKPLVYIGESEDCSDRLRDHNKTKDFWQYALVIISKTKLFTKAHVRYLEWYCIDRAKDADRYRLENDTGRKKTHISESVEADLLDNFEDIKILVSTLGYKLFDAIGKPAPESMLYCKGKGAAGKGQYSEDGFIVFKGSTCSMKETKGFGSTARRRRDDLIETGVLIEKNGFLLFTENHAFSSPSAASDMIRANSSNGWTEWKYKNGKTLDEVKRQ